MKLMNSDMENPSWFLCSHGFTLVFVVSSLVPSAARRYPTAPSCVGSSMAPPRHGLAWASLISAENSGVILKNCIFKWMAFLEDHLQSHISPTRNMDCKLAREIEVTSRCSALAVFCEKVLHWKHCLSVKALVVRMACRSFLRRSSGKPILDASFVCQFSLPRSPKFPHKYMAPWMRGCTVKFCHTYLQQKPHPICKQKTGQEQVTRRPHQAKQSRAVVSSMATSHNFISVPWRLLPYCPLLPKVLALKLIFLENIGAICTQNR